jgi:RimJ/RimL family protein N-acetyltransferase
MHLKEPIMSALQMNCGPSPETSNTPVLETSRLILRAPSLDEAAAIALLANNRKIAEMTALLPHPYDIEDATRWITSLPTETGNWNFGIFAKNSGNLVGVCGYGKRQDRGPEISYWIGEPFWGYGYATEAMRAVIDHLFSITALDEIAAGCRVTNVASRRVLEKCGFQWTGAALFRVRALGASVPADQFRLERRNWASLRAWGQSELPKIAGKKKKAAR